MKFNSFDSKENLLECINNTLAIHAEYMKNDVWRGLPELMNKNNSL